MIGIQLRSGRRWMVALVAAAELACGARAPAPAPAPEPATATAAATAPAPATASNPLPDPTPPAPPLLGTCPPAKPGEAPLTVAEADQRPFGEPLRMLAYLVMHVQPCPPCPPNAQCEACIPQYDLVSDVPPGENGPGGSAWIAPAWFAGEPNSDRLASIEKGQLVMLCGVWERVNDAGAHKVFRVQGLQLQPPTRCPDEVPSE